MLDEEAHINLILKQTLSCLKYLFNVDLEIVMFYWGRLTKKNEKLFKMIKTQNQLSKAVNIKKIIIKVKFLNYDNNNKSWTKYNTYKLIYNNIVVLLSKNSAR